MSASITKQAQAILYGFGRDAVNQFPSHAGWLSAYDLWHHPLQIVLTPQSESLADALRTLSLPDAVILSIQEKSQLASDHPLNQANTDLPHATAFICLGNRCLPPITNPDTLTQTLQQQRRYGDS